jgi:hypothetical protein
MKHPLEEVEIKNALIESTRLGLEDRGIMTFNLGLDYGGEGQGAGGYVLDTPIKDKKGKFIKRVGGAHSMSLIMEILDVVGVANWEDLKGTHIRVKASHTEVHAIGNLLEDNWLNFEEFFNTHK